jgi:hypothetical protein
MHLPGTISQGMFSIFVCCFPLTLQSSSLAERNLGSGNAAVSLSYVIHFTNKKQRFNIVRQQLKEPGDVRCDGAGSETVKEYTKTSDKNVEE